MPARIYIRVAILSAAFLGIAALLVGGAIAHGGGLRYVYGLFFLLWLAAGLLLVHLFLPRFDLSGRTVARLTPGERRLALTFDDGPSPATTAQVLACLARHGVRATFFLVGEQVRRSPELVRAILADGHAVGNHGQTHSVLSFSSPTRVTQEIAAAQRSLGEAGAASVRLFRSPHGWKSLFWGRVLDTNGLQLYAWTRGVWDSDGPPASLIARRVLRRLRDGEIVLLHDGPPSADRSQTVAALDIILPECKRRGFRFVTLEFISKSRTEPGAGILAAGKEAATTETLRVSALPGRTFGTPREADAACGQKNKPGDGSGF